MTTIADEYEGSLLHEGKVLVIDDNESLCRSIELILAKKGCDTRKAFNGRDALSLVDELQFDLAIIDIRLPDVDGTDLLAHLNEAQPGIEVILMTGHATIETAVKALANNAFGYVPKPLDMDNLIVMVSRALKKRRLFVEKLAAEAALRESERKYRVLAEESLQGIAILNERGVAYANAAIAQILERDHDNLLSMDSNTIWNIVHPSERPDVQNDFDRFLSGETSEPRREIRILRPSGEVRFIETFSASIDYDGQPAIQLVMIDRTESKQAEVLRELNQKELEIYNSLLRHDLGNDLQVVLGNLEYLKYTPREIVNGTGDAVNGAIAAAERMFELVTALKQPVDAVEGDIVDLLQRISEDVQKTHPSITIRVHVEDNTLGALARGSRLLPMVFSNLFTNSAKYGGEEVSVSVRCDDDQNSLVVVVSDDGPGVDPKIVDRLFQRGVSTSGGGLGLYLSKAIMEAVGGSIELILGPGKGANFKLLFPLQGNRMCV